jgi:endonuclease/exonuclease/phosphatase family metal-dependent hydrolase
MDRDPEFLAECRALCRAVQPFRTLTALRASPEWRDLGPRFASLLSAIRRYEPPQSPSAPTDETRVLAAHWNVEHGNWYDQVERALLTHPFLQAADVLFFNEIDLGMARAGNRDVTGDLARALGLYGCWAPLFLETTAGRDDDPHMAAGRENEEGLFGLAILSRWPIGEVRTVELPSPERLQFELERMVGRHIGLVAVIERPGAPFVAVSTHLEVHRTRRDRARQMEVLTAALRKERRPVVLAGDFNSHTFDRGRWWDPVLGAIVLLAWPGKALLQRLLYPDRGPARERLFDALREADFEWNRLNDRRPTLRLRFDRLDEARWLRVAGSLVEGLLRWAEGRGRLRLDWFAARGWRSGRGSTVAGLDGPGKASDHAPIVAEFRT